MRSSLCGSESGAIGHVEGTWNDPGGFKVTLEIAGDGGLLEFNCNQPTGVPFRSALAGGDGPRAGVAVPESPVAINPYEAELAHYLDCLERGVTPDILPEDGREAVRNRRAALESIETGMPVTLNAAACRMSDLFNRLSTHSTGLYTTPWEPTWQYIPGCRWWCRSYPTRRHRR